MRVLAVQVNQKNPTRKQRKWIGIEGKNELKQKLFSLSFERSLFIIWLICMSLYVCILLCGNQPLHIVPQKVTTCDQMRTVRFYPYARKSKNVHIDFEVQIFWGCCELINVHIIKAMKTCSLIQISFRSGHYSYGMC